MSKDLIDSALFSELTHALLAGGAGFSFEAKGRSMWPTIQDGDILQVQRTNWAKLRLGDIVLFKTCDGLKAHRIIRRRGESFVTRGDAGIDVDGEIRREQLLGKVVGMERRSSGQLIPLSNTWDHARFFWRELRRLLSRS